MYLTNNVLRRELEHIAEQPRVPMTTRSAWTTQNILFWGEGTRPADAERHEQIFGRARPGRFDSDAMPMSSNTHRYFAPRHQRLSTAEGNRTVILVTGGLGFIGSHTTRALLDLGESCVLVQRRTAEVPDDMVGEVGRRVFIERADITDRQALVEIGKRHKITGIVHLAGSMPWPPGADEPIDGARRAIDSLLNVLEAARNWEIARVGAASTIGVYGGVAEEPPYREDMTLPMTAGHVIPAFKKIGELLADYVSDATDLEVISLRIGSIWGPLGRAASPFFAAPQLVHAAVRGTSPDLSTLPSPARADDGIDLCYVRDCGRAIALLQVTKRLSYRTYNVGTGRVTTYGELASAIKKIVPDAKIGLPGGRDPNGRGRDLYLDITRIRQDTGYQPAYDAERATADYIDWLRAGNER